MNIDEAFGIHEQALKLKARRAEVLAGNIANEIGRASCRERVFITV